MSDACMSLCCMHRFDNFTPRGVTSPTWHIVSTSPAVALPAGKLQEQAGCAPAVVVWSSLACLNPQNFAEGAWHVPWHIALKNDRPMYMPPCSVCMFRGCSQAAGGDAGLSQVTALLPSSFCAFRFSIAMAGRAHKKLLQQQLGADLPPAAPSSEEEESSEEETEGASAAPFNPFTLLTDSEVRRARPETWCWCATA